MGTGRRLLLETLLWPVEKSPARETVLRHG